MIEVAAGVAFVFALLSSEFFSLLSSEATDLSSLSANAFTTDIGMISDMQSVMASRMAEIFDITEFVVL